MKQTSQSRERTCAIKDSVLIALFVVAICLPSLGMAFRLDVVSEQQENRRLAKFPPLALNMGVLLPFPGRFKDYFNDNFAFRRTMVRWQAEIKVNYLGMSSSPLVIIGKDGWLFYADEYSNDGRRAVPLFTDKELERWRQILEARRDWLAQHGIRYLFVIAPHKHTIYPEYLPDTLTQLAKESRFSQLAAYLKEHSNLEFVDLRPGLNEAKARHIIYHRTDGHWNFYGGFAAYQPIIKELAKSFPELQPVPESDLEVVTQKFSGDLARFLGLYGFMIEERPIIGLRKPSYVVTSIKDTTGNATVERPLSGSDKMQWIKYNLGTMVTTERKESKLPRAMVFHDSATPFYAPFLAEHFSRAVFKYAPVLDLKLIESEHPDVVIQEMGEMFLMVPPPADWPEIMSIARSKRREARPVSDGASNASPQYDGFHDVANCETIYGWAWDKNRPDTALDVEVYDGNTLIATVSADLFRPDLLNAGIGDGEHAFSYQLPPSMKDGRAHSIWVRIAGTGFNLKNTPKAVTCGP